MNSARSRMVIENVLCQYSISYNIGQPYKSSDHIWATLSILSLVLFLLCFSVGFGPWRHLLQVRITTAMLRSKCLVKILHPFGFSVE
jgi:hypothetical protein